MFKHLQKLLLLLALCVPWVTQAQTTCQLTIIGEDGYGDGWNDGYLTVTQGTTTVTWDAPGSDHGYGGPFQDTTVITVSSDSPVTFSWTEGEYDDEVTIWIYNSDGVLLFSVNEPIEGTIFTLGSPCSNCFAPGSLSVDSLSSDFARVAWEGSADTYGVIWGESADVAGGNGTATTATSNSFEMSNLTTGTAYTIMVWTICDGNETSDTVTLIFATVGEAVSEFPYTTGFEAGDDIAWDFVNDANNKWFVGAGEAHNGTNGLYISNDNGTTNAYTVSGTQFSYAYRALDIADGGQYAISFDWKAYGESNYDYLRAWIAPSTMQLSAGHDPEGGTSAYSYRTSTPTGWIDLGGKMNLQSSWQTAQATPSIAAGNYYLVFMWANDASGGTQPPVAIDNVVVTQLTCSAPTDLTATPHSYDVDLTWTPLGDESEWEITVSDTMVYYSQNSSYTVTDLEPYTYYHFAVRAICGAGDTSFSTTSGNVRTLPSCPQPTNLTVDSVTTTELFLSWTAGNEETEWSVLLNDSYFVTSDNPLWIQDLDPNTPFSITVRALCNADDSSFATTINTRTLAGEPISEFPFVCGFEINDDDENEAAVWVLENNTPNGWYVGTATNNGGSKSLYISNDNGSTNSYTTSTACVSYAYVTFQMEAGEYAYSFDWKTYGESSWDFLRAAIAPFGTATPNSGWTSTSVASGYTVIDGGYMNQQSNWQTKTGTFTITESGIYNFCLVWRNDGSSGTNPPAAVDNVFIMPLTCPAPTAFGLDTIEPNQATLHWTSIGDESEWLVRAVSAAGADDWQSVSSNPYVYTDLSSGTNYTFELVAVCGDGDTSLMVSCTGATPVTCPAPTGLTSENTDFGTTVSWTDQTGTAWDVVYGYLGFNPYTSEDIETVSTTSFDMTDLDTGFYDVYVRTNCGDGDYSTWVGPITVSFGITVMNMATTGSDTLYTCAAIIYDDGGPDNSYSSNCQSTLVIYPSTPDNYVVISGTSYTESSFDYLRIYDGVGTNGEELWNDYGVDATQTFGPFASEAITVVFHSDGSVVYSGFAINVSCIEPSDCPRPSDFEVTGVTPDSVYFSWVDEEGADWVIAYGPTGFPLGSASTTYVGFNDTYGGIGELNPNTEYDFYLMSVCGAGDTSWTRMLTVRTACSFIASLPWSQDFESAPTGSSSTGSAFVNCMNRLNNGTSYGGYPYVSSSTTYNHTPGGSRGLYWYNTTTQGTYGDYQIVVMPGINTDSIEIQSLQFKFWAKSSSSSYYPVFQVGVMDNPNDANTFTEVASINVGNNTDWTEFTAALGSYTGTGNYIALRALRPTSSWYAYVDDLTIEYTPNCPPATDLTVGGTTTQGAYLHWSYLDGVLEDEPAGYEVEYYEVGSSNSPVTVTTTEPYIFLNGLTPSTEYHLRVRLACGDDEFGAPDSINFSTLGFGCAQVDESTSFSDTIGNGTTTSNYLPSYSFYNYGMSQQIFTAAEIGHGGEISQISFMMQAVTQQRTYEIYMGHVDVATASSYLNPADLTCVYNGGPVTMTANQWTTFNLTTPFAYNGSSNLLVVFRDLTGSYVSGNYGYVHSAQSGSSMYSYTDNGPYTPGTGSGTSLSVRNNIILAGASCSVEATCAAPAVAVLSTDQSSVSIAWVAGASETSWNIEYREAGAETWTSAATAVTATTYTINNLNPATDYEVRVVTVCTEGNYYGVAEFSTSCAPSALPLTEDFQNVSTGTFQRNCWLMGTTNLGSSYPYPYVVTLQGDAENQLLLMYNGAYMVLNQVAAPLNQLQVRFTFTQGGDNVHFLMGLLENQNDPISSIHVLDTIVRSEIDTTSVSVSYTYSFADINPEYNNYYIAFWDAFNENYSFIDNLVVEYIPSCAPVTGLAANNVTTNSADISWTGSGSATYIVEYGPRNFTLGTGTVLTSAAQGINLTGLNHSTNYDLYVYTVCGAGDTSIASPVLQFTTQCDVITVLPYSIDFENIMPAGSSATNVLPNCWASEAFTGTMPHITWSSSATYYQSPTHSLYFYDEGVVALPQMSIPINQTMVSFFDYNANAGTYGLIIGAVDNVDSGFASTFDPIDTIIFDNGNGAYNVNSFLAAYNGSANHIAIKNFNAAGNGYATHYLDDIVVDYLPSCIAPQRVRTVALTNVSADLAWFISNAPSYSIEYGPQGFTPGTGTTVTSNTNGVSLAGLNALTTYDVRIVALCSTTDVSDTTVYTFTTLRAAPVNSYPYVCTFADSAMANAWEPVNGTQANQWYLGSAAYNGAADTRAIYISNDNGVSNAYSTGTISHTYIYRTFNMNAGSYNIGFDWKAYGEGSYDFLRALLVPADVELVPGQTIGGGTSSYSFGDNVPAGCIALDGPSRLNVSNSWQTVNVDVSVLTSGTYNLVFYWGNDGSVGTQPPAAVDNVEVYLNTCPAPVNLTASSMGSSSFELSWTDLGTPQSWIVEYGPAGYAHNPAVATSMAVTSQPVTISGLDAVSNYDVYVRPVCAGADTGRWAMASFQTAMCDNASIVETWDSTMTSTTSSYAPIGYSYYDYGYVQTLIDSARFAELTGEISAFAFKPNSATAGDMYEGMTVWMANVPETDLSAGPIIPDETDHIFVKVIDNASFSYTTNDWQMHAFDTNFTWDGHSNVLVSVKRDNGDYTSGSSFSAHSTSGPMTRYYYQDNTPISETAPSASNSGTQNLVADMRFYACGVGCSKPTALIASNVNYQGAMFSWMGTADSYEVAYMAATDVAYPAPVTVTNTNYSVNNLQPATTYRFHVRAVCDSEEGLVSNWVETTIVTDSLPCFTPSGLTVTTGYTTATMNWTENGIAAQWLIHVWNSNFDTTCIAYTNPFTLGGLDDAQTYYASVASNCGGIIESDNSDTVTFTTTTCAPVSGVAVSNITPVSALVTWNGTASSYEVQCVLHGYGVGQGTQAFVQTTQHTLGGLDSETEYDVYVRAICETGVNSQWSQVVTFTTSSGTVTTYTITATANDATMGTVSGGGTYPAGTSVTLTATANPGYVFVNWNDGVTTSSRTITVNADASYVANFEAIPTYHITVSANNPDWGTVTGGGTFEVNTTTTITATANAGYQFVSWDDGNSEAVRTITVTADHNYVATFVPEGAELNYYDVTVNVNNPTMGTVTGGGTHIVEGSIITLTATANAGYRFVNWNDGVTDNPRQVTVNSDMTFTANFEALPTYTITVNVNDPAMGTVTGGGTYPEGTEVTLTATPNNGYEFVKWNDNVTTPTRVITVTANATYTATFRASSIGIAEAESMMNVSVYPNPATSTTTVALSGVSGDVTITVVDMNGRVVKSDAMSCDGSCTKLMEVGELAQGAYFIRVSGENVNMVKKLIVK